MPIALLLASCGGRPPESRCPTEESTDFADNGLLAEPARFGLAEEDLYLGVVAKVFDAAGGELGGGDQILSIVDTKPEEVVILNVFALASGEPSKLIHLVAAERIRDKLRDVGVAAALRVHVRRTMLVLSLADSQLFDGIWDKVVEQAESKPPGASLNIHEVRRDYYVNAGLGALASNPRKGSLGADLVALGELLAELADTIPDRRPEALRRARAAAEALALRLRGLKPKVRRQYHWEEIMRRNSGGTREPPHSPR